MLRPAARKRLVPAAVGLMAATPLILWAVTVHAAGYEAGSWTAPVTPRLALDFLSAFHTPPQLGLVALVTGGALAAGWSARSTSDPGFHHPALILPLALGALPALLLVVSTVAPPLTMERYAFPAVVATMVMAAALIARASPLVACVCLVVVTAHGTLALKRNVEFNQAVDQQSEALVAQVRELLSEKYLIVFESAQQYCLLDQAAPDLRQRVHVLNFDRHDLRTEVVGQGQLRERAEVRLFERDLLRRLNPVLGRPQLISPGTLRTSGAPVWLVLRRDDEPMVWSGARLLMQQGRMALVKFE
jgi:hypothetical protein